MELIGIQKEIWQKKYKDKNDKTIKDTWYRVANSIASIERDAKLWRNEFFNLLEDFYFLPGGRITNGAGTAHNYLLNCGTVPLYDSIAGEFSIARAAERAAYMSKCNYGIGLNPSVIRPKDAPLSNGGTASGVVSFLGVFNSWIEVIKSGGENRRGALISVLIVSHPDIFEYIDSKREEGKLTNFNISVGITKEFIDAVKSDSNFNLVFDNKVYQTVKAKDIWNKLVESGFLYNDPGLLMLDEVNKWNNLYWLYDIDAVNP